MTSRWLSLFFRLASYSFDLKQKIIQSGSWLIVVPYTLLLIILELGLVIISLPIYLLVPPKRVQERGFIFPKATKDNWQIKNYTIRRKIGLTTVLGAGGLFLLKILFIAVVSFYIFGLQQLLADTQDWTFNTPADYTYDSNKIEVVGGVAQLKDVVGSVVGSTTNPGFNTNTSGWTSTDWDRNGGEVNPTESRVTSGGNPGAYINISIPSGKDDELGGYWSNSFVVSTSSPTANISFDWQVSAYDSTPNPITFKLYVFVDNASGAPVIGQQVWDSGEITSTSGWVSVSSLDVSSKISAAGTYYLKVATWIETPGSNGGPYTVGYDNVQLNWSKTTHSYASDKPTITPVASLSLPKAVSWNSFSETATKNGGEIYYQLSSDNGANWKFWNNANWATSTLSTDYNPASVVNSNINTFATSTNQIKWRAYLSGNGSQQVILDNISITYTQNQRPEVQNLVPAQNTGYGAVHVDYNLLDAESDPVNLTAYEYSLTGAFSGEQTTMVASTTDPNHNGVSGLSALPAGVGHTFVWDAYSQLGNTYNPNVYVRLRPNDVIGNGNYATSTSFSVDYVTSTVSNLSATQGLGSTTVAITYDLFDNTTDNILVELQISDDGGSTWVVATSSATGVGLVTAGNGKTINWNAGADYSGQQKSNMQVRVRAKDKWQNQGDYATSANFSLDTLLPATNDLVNLLAQPNAGDSTVLISGSFTEVNPSTNDFYVAINGGAYSASTAGTSNTATPANQNTNIGSTLDGNDYISKTKIIHTDDYGLVFANENTNPNSAYKYVKPYTPDSPVLNNPVTTRLDLLVSPHVGESSDVEYVIYEVSTDKYVQSDGTLGVDPVWKTLGTGSGQWGNALGITGKIRITGLSSPVSLYSFKVKSRNPSDTAHAVSSESAWSATSAISNTAPVINLNGYAQTTDGTQYAHINYTGTDGQGDINNIVTYQYSTDNSNWQTMTEKGSVGSDGVSNLVFLPTGSDYNFVWDSGADLPNIEDASVYTRLKSNDTQIDGNLATSLAWEIDNKLPTITGVSASQNPGAKTVAITYNLADANNSLIQMEISSDGGGAWSVAAPSVSGAIGSGVAPGSKTITWNAGVDFNGQYNSQMKVRVRARDTFGNQGDYVNSANFVLDTHAPVLSNISASQNAGAKIFTFHYDVSEEIGNASIVLAISGDGGSNWTVPITSATGDLGTVVPGTNKTITWDAATDYNDQERLNMKIRLTASDSFTNSSNLASDNFSLDSLAPRITGVSALQTLGSTNVVFQYTLADQNNSNIEIDISEDAGVSWSVTDTSVTGDVGNNIGAGDKSITWNAGTDFDEQQQSDLRFRVRGTDTYSNASNNVSSVNFSLDTKNPTVNVLANLQSQPNAGNTTVLIGGSFTEANPNTNDFYVAINGGAYSSPTGGVSNTASPTNQNTNVGVTLDGNDYISGVKIIHIDDYGQLVINENNSPTVGYLYVKPYTPAIPTVDNPTVGTVDVSINKNPAETDGLEYAIYESSQNKYVQGDGTLGTDPVWQRMGTASGEWGNNTSVSGKVRVSGLSNDSYTYQFQMKSRNVSDGSHAVSSESAMGGGASSANQSPVIVINNVVQTTDGSKYVTIDYTGSDLESENCDLISYEYSTNNLNWQTMTEKGGVGSNGISGLNFAYTGSAYKFMWDLATDLSNTEDDTVYIRLRANDGTSDGGLVASSAFIVDTKIPVISALSSGQNLGSNNVAIGYNLADLSQSSVTLEISSDGGLNWDVPTSTAVGHLGINIDTGSSRSITWNPGIDFSGQESSTVRVRLRAVDNFGNQGSIVSSANFSVDTKAPVFGSVSASQNVGDNTVTITYNSLDTNNFTTIIDISDDNGFNWSVTDVSTTGAIGAGVTPGNGKTIIWDAGTDFFGHDISSMKVRVQVTDTYNNPTGYVESAPFSLDTQAPIITNVLASQNLGSNNLTFRYDLADSDNVTINLDISDDGGTTWSVAKTTLTGAVGAGVGPGTAKEVYWNAGVDYNGQQNNNLKIRVRGTDNFSNTSSNVESSGVFSVDTLDPAINDLVDLQSQPNAGDSSVLLGGSFVEANPSVNEFTAAISGGAYAVSTTGESNTASPANQLTSVTSLTGHDYVSRVKLIESDKYGHQVINENNSPRVDYKFVKPFTPSQPTVSNPQNDSVDLIINPHAGEASDVEYAIYEVSTGKYVQASGSLGASAVWKILGTGVGEWGNLSGIFGKIEIIGLTSPVANYSFMVKSRNPSDVAHAASSESTYSSVAGINNTAPTINIISVSQVLSGSYVVVNYSGTDTQNDSNDLNIFEYSTNGLSWQAMTEKIGVSSDGVDNLVFHSAGTAYFFAWDVANDLPNQEQITVYVRLRSSDTLADSNISTSAAFYTDTRGPVISNLMTSQAPGSNLVTFNYDLGDSSGADNNITLEISDDNGATYTVPITTLTGDVGGSVSAGVSRTITWDAGIDFIGQESNSMKVRIRGTDRYGNSGNYLLSGSFSVDAKAPIVSDVTANQASGSSNIVINYNLADNTSAGHLVDFSISSDNGLTWTVSTTTRSGDIGAGQTTGAKSFIWSAGTDFSGQDLSTMKARVRARDYFGDQGAYVASASFSVDTKSPVFSGISVDQNLGSDLVNINYDLSETANIILDISSDGGANWNVGETSLIGDLGAVSAGNNKLINWHALVDFGNQENSIMRVRLRGVDSFGNTSIYYESSDFTVDSAPPLGLLSLNKFSSTNDSATLNWSANSDAHFNHYELWHGVNQNDVENRIGTTSKWGILNDANLSDPLTISTVITGLDLTADYFVKIWAVDDFGNEITVPVINLYETPVTPPTPTSSGGGNAVIIDNQPPVKPIISPLVTPTLETSITVFGLAEPRAIIELYDNGVLIGNLDNPTNASGIFNQTFKFNAGLHSLTVRAGDKANNFSSFSDPVALNIIVLVPTIPIILTPQNNLTIIEATPQIIGVSDPNNQIIITVDQNKFTVSSNSDGAWSFVLPNTFALSDGQHTISVIAQDSTASQSAPATITVTKTTEEIVAPITIPIVTPIPTPEIISLPSAALISEVAGAVELPGIPVPEVTTAGASITASGDVLSFTGVSLPNSDVVVYIHSNQALVYSAHTDQLGNWKINHSQAVSELAPGEHTIYAVALDTNANVKSRPSAVSSFTVQRDFWVMIYNYFNWQTTTITLIILLLAMFLLRHLQTKTKV